MRTPVVTVSVIESYGEVEQEFQICCRDSSFEGVCKVQEELAKVYHDKHVNFVWEPKRGGRKSFVLGMVYDEMVDQERLAKGEMTEEEFRSKWWPDWLKTAA